ncbi:MAG: hypothetical protein HYY17_02350 [Planctomycetes bacterium]|nr:hypothetical protein [Planctomycetota bacterium]
MSSRGGAFSLRPPGAKRRLRFAQQRCVKGWPTYRLLRRHSGYRFRRRYRRLLRERRFSELGPRVAAWTCHAVARPAQSARLRACGASAWRLRFCLAPLGERRRIGRAAHADTWGLRRAVLGW